MNRGRALLIGLLVVAVVGGAYLGGSQRRAGPPLDPRSTTADGTRGLVLLLERFGTEVSSATSVPDDRIDVVVLFRDRLDSEAADELEAWVRGGGTLVVADPGSLFTPRSRSRSSGTVTGTCATPALTAVGELDTGDRHSRFSVDDTSNACFSDANGAFVVFEERGAGRVVGVGGPTLFTNQYLDSADNAVLAVGLLGGDGVRVTILSPSAIGTGERGLGDLIGSPVWAMMAQLLVAFGVIIWWRSRRLGQPVIEPQPVTISGSELTRAVGMMLANNRHPERAAAILRDRARRDLAPRLGLSLDAPADVVVQTIERVTTLSENEIRRATVAAVTNDQDLVDVAHLLSRIHEEIHGYAVR